MIQFGTGGWRAIIGDGFTKENVELLAQSVAELMKSENNGNDGFVLGFDRRFLSSAAAKWFGCVLAGNGIKVYLIDREAPTPLIMYATQKMNAAYGAAVTASHNPAEYNGVKIFTRGGRDATETVTDKIEAVISRTTPSEIRESDYSQAAESGMITVIDPFNEYIDAILEMIDVPAIRSRGLRVLLDPMFGVSKTSLQTILITARCGVDLINDRRDALFGGRLPSPTTETLRTLKNMVVEKGYDLGIGTDGDADRLGIIDEKGTFIHPNYILAALYYYLLEFKHWKGPVVRNIATTHLLDRIAAAFGEKCYEVPVGFKYISSMMEEKNALIGGESSGGLTIRGHIKGKDGIFAASLLIEMICVTGKRLSEILGEIFERFGACYMAEDSYRVDEKRKEELSELLFQRKLLPDFGYEIERICYTDGVKVSFKNGGWAAVRFSGTEPLLRVFAEMDQKDSAARVCSEIKDFLNL